jgi:hypothetical protein
MITLILPPLVINKHFGMIIANESQARVLLSGRGDSPPLPNLAIDFFRSPLSPLPSHSDAPASLAQPFSPSLAQAGSLSRGIYHLPHPSSVAHDSRPKTPRLAFIPVHLTCAV